MSLCRGRPARRWHGGDNAVNSKDHTMLVAAIKAAGLVDALKGPGPYTVFAPTNTAFQLAQPASCDGQRLLAVVRLKCSTRCVATESG